MTKSDLENRMAVMLRDGTVYIVVDDVLVGVDNWDDIDNYTEDLKIKNSSRSLDIIAVFDKITRFTDNKICLWERPEVKEVTMAEVEEKFGCKVKIVKE